MDVHNARQESSQLKVQFTSEHFIFYSIDKDKPCLKDLSETLETNYSRITATFKPELPSKIRVRVYPDIDEFQISIGWLESLDWFVGCLTKQEIRMVSPLNPGKIHSYHSLLIVAVHEFAHLVQSALSVDSATPLWLDEGVAMYEAGQMDEHGRRAIARCIKNDCVPSLNELESGKLCQSESYEFYYTIAEFIVTKFGYDKLIKLIKAPTDYQDIFGISGEEFENQWLSYLAGAYCL
jgi:hypothetical protein